MTAQQILTETTWWHLYPLGAVGAPIRDRQGDDSGHRILKLIPWLSYAKELGCSGILLGPIFTSTAHGYDTLDYFELDPRLGDAKDWQVFVSEAKTLGLKICLDGVFNHVGVQNKLVSESLSAGHGLVKLASPNPQHWEGNLDLAVLDHDSPEVKELIISVMKHWLALGADAWRLDAAYSVPADFWRETLSEVRKEYPDALFIGEVIHGDYPKIVEETTIDSLTQYELWKAIWSSLKETNMWELAHALERHQQFCESFIPQTFIGNHDVTRIASQVGELANVAAVLLFTLPGCPSIYYGDEVGYVGAKGADLSADDALRPPLPDSIEVAGEQQGFYSTYKKCTSMRNANTWLSNGKLSVLDKQNEWISYRVENGDNSLVAHIQLSPEASVDVKINGVPLELI